MVAQEAGDVFEPMSPKEDESERDGGDSAETAKRGDTEKEASAPMPDKEPAAQPETNTGVSGQATMETATPVAEAAIAGGDEATMASGGNDEDAAAAAAGAAEGSTEEKTTGLETADGPAAGERQQ